eukprot:CAMPEP_0184740554 /NCGR_PEP_ID=MMETSP0315-20130426/3537_1 /TAXON_ID=101924 /ORGANISM="Rhodosorus marinus, Strain UTEX LB 2760" /LENGTH=651 /DNA_ID=CAMNT_0027210257 /DNA_START=106 /DNA_END=2061 /DNA_ORIENTATION=+
MDKIEAVERAKDRVLESARTIKDELAKKKAGVTNSTRVANAMLNMRAAHRDSLLLAEEIKKKALEANEALVVPKIKLEGLIYLAAQLRKEIQACKAYEGTYKKLELLEEREALEPEQAKSMSEHEKTMARLDMELSERKRLQTKAAELLSNQRRQELENISTRKFIAELPAKLEIIAAAAKPVKDQFFSSRIAKSSIGKVPSFSTTELETISSLPTPLYIAYREAAAYRDAFEESMLVSAVEDESQYGKQAVSLRLRDENENSRNIELIIRYNSELGVASLESRSSFLATKSLCLLYPADDGLKLPNPSAAHSTSSESKVQELCGGGLPFMFIQVLCGLSFPDRIEKKKRSSSGGSAEDFNQWKRVAVETPLHARFGAVISAIRNRSKMIHNVELVANASTPPTAPLDVCKLPAVPKTVCSPWKEHSSDDDFSRIYNFELRSIRSTQKLQKFKIEVQVKIRVDFPYKRPEWSFSSSVSAITSEDFDAMRTVLASYAEEYIQNTQNPPELLLQCLLMRLRAMIDVIVETELDDSGAPEEIGRRPRWLNAFEGPLRQRPLKYNEDSQIFERPTLDKSVHIPDREPEPLERGSLEKTKSGLKKKLRAKDPETDRKRRKSSKSAKKSSSSSKSKKKLHEDVDEEFAEEVAKAMDM